MKNYPPSVILQEKKAGLPRDSIVSLAIKRKIGIILQEMR